MISVVAPFFVAAAFCVAIASIWLSKPINRRLFFHDTGYDERHPPTPREWRNKQLKYTGLLIFLGTLFTIVVWISTNS